MVFEFLKRKEPGLDCEGRIDKLDTCLFEGAVDGGRGGTGNFWAQSPGRRAVPGEGGHGRSLVRSQH